MADGPRRDTRGIVDAPDLFAHVCFRRRAPAAPLRPYLEHYWLIDWDLAEPYAAHVVPHPSVNLVFERYEAKNGTPDRPGRAEVAGVDPRLFTRKLAGRGRVCGVQFRPGGFRPFAPEHAVRELTGRRVAAADVLRTPPPVDAVLEPDDEDARVAALDACLLALEPRPDPRAALAMAAVDRVRTDRTVRRVDRLARDTGLSPAPCNGCSPRTSASAPSGSSSATASTRPWSAPRPARPSTGRGSRRTSATATRPTWCGTSPPRSACPPRCSPPLTVPVRVRARAAPGPGTQTGAGASYTDRRGRPCAKGREGAEAPHRAGPVARPRAPREIPGSPSPADGILTR